MLNHDLIERGTIGKPKTPHDIITRHGGCRVERLTMSCVPVPHDMVTTRHGQEGKCTHDIITRHGRAPHDMVHTTWSYVPHDMRYTLDTPTTWSEHPTTWSRTPRHGYTIYCFLGARGFNHVVCTSNHVVWCTMSCVHVV